MNNEVASLMNNIDSLSPQRKTIFIEIFENAQDIVKTAVWFGWGHSAFHLIFVRQNVYQAIIHQGFHRGLIFNPIQLV